MVRASTDERETRIIEYPFEDIEAAGEGKVVSRSYEGVLAFRNHPFVVKILSLDPRKWGFIDVEKLIREGEDREWIRNWYGCHQEFDKHNVFYFTGQKELEKTPRVGMSFHGVVCHHDVATMSDFYKRNSLGDDLVMEGVTVLEDGETSLVMGELRRFHRDSYTSFPIVGIEEISSEGLEEILLDKSLSEKEKSERLRDLD